jgi:hypothetical protein
MLNYAETASSSTILPVQFIPCIQPQERVVTLSYAIGPIDSAQVITTHAHLSTGDECSLLVPVHLPRPILDDPAFRDGYEYNYLTEEEGDEGEEWTASVARLVNHIYSSLTDTRLYRNFDTDEVTSDFLPWQVGWLLRDLTRLAETGRTLAYVGIGHLCFLLPLLTQNRPVNLPCYEPHHADILHTRAVKAYRGRVRVYREQGKSFAEAQRLALIGSAQ